MSSAYTTEQRVQALEKELETFSYSVAHDLHAPLRAILHFSKMLNRRAADKLEPRDRELLGQIPELAGQAQQMLDALLAYARIGQDGINIVPLDLATIAREVAAEAQAGHPDCRCTITLDSDMPQLNGDLALVTRLLHELISNALQFHDQQVRQVHIGYNHNDKAFFIRDDGIGISPSGLERIGSIFCRLHSPGSYGDGLGIGLSVAKKITRLHHGRLWLTSTPEQGSCAYFQLGDSDA